MASELIGLDIGRARTGLARASTFARLAEPLTSVPTNDLVEKLKDMLEASEIEAIAIGLPRNLRSEDTEQTRWVRDFINQLKSQINIPLYWQDEALTSKRAEAMNPKAKKRSDEHALAATIILQDWIDTADSERVRC